MILHVVMKWRRGLKSRHVNDARGHNGRRPQPPSGGHWRRGSYPFGGGTDAVNVGGAFVLTYETGSPARFGPILSDRRHF
jgi:hypothetical protein